MEDEDQNEMIARALDNYRKAVVNLIQLDQPDDGYSPTQEQAFERVYEAAACIEDAILILGGDPDEIPAVTEMELENASKMVAAYGDLSAVGRARLRLAERALDVGVIAFSIIAPPELQRAVRGR